MAAIDIPDDFWRKLYAGLAISPVLVQAYGNTPDILAQRAWDIGDAMLAEGKRREAADPAPDRRGGLEPTVTLGTLGES